MKGISFVVDETGKKTSVLIDLAEWGELWEDFYDVLVTQAREAEPALAWDELRAEVEQDRRDGD